MDQTWTKLGFTLDRQSDHVRATLTVGEIEVIRTRRSHGSKAMKGRVPYLIRQQMKLNEMQFAGAVKCPLKEREYLEILRKKGHLPTDA